MTVEVSVETNQEGAGKRQEDKHAVEDDLHYPLPSDRLQYFGNHSRIQVGVAAQVSGLFREDERLLFFRRGRTIYLRLDHQIILEIGSGKARHLG